MTDYDSFVRAALGRSATLGDLYDARGDCFLDRNIFRKKLPSDAVMTLENPSLQSEFFSSDKISEKIQHLGAQGDLSLSLLCDLITIHGSGEYLKEQKKSAHELQVTLMQKMRTADERINVYDDVLKDCVNMEALSEETTHVVVGIEWGANTNVVVTYRFNHGEDKGKLAMSFKGGLDKLFDGLLKLEVSGKVGSKNSEDVLSKELSVKVFADVLPNEEGAPANVEEAVRLVQNMPARVKETNNGKGRQLHFRMLPLNVFVKAFSTSIKIDNVLHVIGVKVVKQVEQSVDQANEHLEELSDFCAHIEMNKRVLPSSVVEETRKFFCECQVEYADWKQKMGSSLRAVRSGKEDEDKLIDLVQDFFKSSKIVAIPTMLDNENIRRRLQITEELHKEGIVTDGEKLRSVRSASGDKGSFVLFYSFERDHKQENFEKTIQSFISLKRNEPSSRFIAVDDDICKDAWKAEGVPEGFRICAIHNRRYTNVDLLEELEELALQCVMKCSEKMVRGTRSGKGVPVKLICPKWVVGEKCAGTVHEWVCETCRRKVDFGFDGRFYCDCGYQAVEKFGFRCNDPHHGDQYVEYGSALGAQLKKIKPMDKADEKMCVMKCSQNMIRGEEEAPTESACHKWVAGENCAGTVHEWICEMCRTNFVFDGRFYCDCGYQAVEKFGFRCNYPHHGNQYVKYGSVLEAPLKRLN